MTYQFSQKVSPNIFPSVCAVRLLPGVLSNWSVSWSVELNTCGGCPTRARGMEYSTSTSTPVEPMSTDTSRPAALPSLLASLASKVLRWQSKQS
ncbi:hypothetical protein AB1Y20_011939 [Prymnesium parvum]|uniref:Uncharacterized protein n=1 Tax=Prymnesium parvum TaxID=97485 RepID=A0AB34IN29_PRYPA